MFFKPVFFNLPTLFLWPCIRNYVKVTRHRNVRDVQMSHYYIRKFSRRCPKPIMWSNAGRRKKECRFLLLSPDDIWINSVFRRDLMCYFAQGDRKERRPYTVYHAVSSDGTIPCPVPSRGTGSGTGRVFSKGFLKKPVIQKIFKNYEKLFLKFSSKHELSWKWKLFLSLSLVK